MIARIGNLYAGVRQIENQYYKWSFLYHPMFLMQRLGFVLIPLIFYKKPTH